MSDLDELYDKVKTEIFPNHDDGSGDTSQFKFDFAFALLAFCCDWHSGMMSDLYVLMSALTLEWRFEANRSWYDEDNFCQKEIYDWLSNEFDVTQEE